MKREIWEELVDRVVDGECSGEEKRALEEAAAQNPEIRDAIRSALRIRELMRSCAGATAPPEFSERLRLAIERSDFWVEREVERTAPIASTSRRARFGRFGGRRVVEAATGTAVSFAAVALLTLGVGGGERWDGAGAPTPSIVETPKAENAESLGAAPNAVAPGRIAPNAPFIRWPLAGGDAPNAPDLAVPSEFYARRALDPKNAPRLLAEFSTVCNRNGVSHDKMGGDYELLLRRTTPEARRAIFAWLAENARETDDRGPANLAERWDENDESVRPVRISFCVAKNK